MNTLQGMYGNNGNFKPYDISTNFGAVDKYFGDQLKGLGWTGSVFDNSSLMGGGGGDNGNDITLGANNAFLDFAKKNNLSTSVWDQGDKNTLRLMQGNNVLGEKTYTTNNALDKFADVAVPLAIALGSGGVLGQALGFVSPTSTPFGGGGLTGLDAAAVDAGAGLSGGAGGSVVGESLASGLVGSAPVSPYALSGASFGEAGAIGSTGLPGLGSGGMGAGAASGLSGTGAGLGISNTGAALSTAGLGGAVSGGNSLKSLFASMLPGAIRGAVSGESKSGGMDYNNLLSGLFGMYAGNKQQQSLMDLYKNLDNSFAPGSAYEKTLRQELDRRDAAAGRNSQYGPREVELQAKLAQQRSNNATALANILDKSNDGFQDMIRSGLYLGNESGLTDIFGGMIKNIGDKVVDGVTDSDWWHELFGG